MLRGIWTSAIFLMSCGKLGEREGPQFSKPYDTDASQAAVAYIAHPTIMMTRVSENKFSICNWLCNSRLICKSPHLQEMSMQLPEGPLLPMRKVATQ